jgi:5-methylthioadenosine/S-adenosylhomocysteine deaminase
MHLHLSETEREVQECIERYGKTPVEWFNDLGTFDRPVTAAHCVAVRESDIAIMREKGVGVIHNPSSNMKLGSGFAPLRRFLDEGINVALGTDGASSNNMLDILGELRLAAILHKGVSRRADETKAAQMYDLITVNGAKSQGRADCGVIEAGKKADIVLIDMDAVSTIPCYDTDAALAYSVKSSNVVMTMVDGRVLYENGEYKTIDVEKIKYDFKEIQKHYFD